ncbi:putative porin [Gaetbulibacter saemankumensis]|uniref:putative porin n=1 Tax=Gaetbulibacter saemankumensis TaxID=311208 RepID=UPI00040F781D|nr:putative porin [Gaetbulibacter saemankumensis]
MIAKPITIYVFLTWFIIPFLCFGQEPIEKKLKFNADFRFRIEEDWNSKKSDDSFRDNRTRLRYRLRAGFNYKLNHWSDFGARIRTGLPNKQQDPQITLGDGFAEFNVIPLGFEKLYFQAEQKGYKFWLGKNTFPFYKQHELFWSDNVYPEGLFFKKKVHFNSSVFDQLDINAGHFIIRASGTSLDKDRYFQGLQASTTFLKQKIALFSSLYYFKNMPNIPDGGETFTLDYAIFNIGTTLRVSQPHNIYFEIDYYHNFEDYNQNENIVIPFKNQKNGLITGISYGSLKQKKDWKFKATYSYLERYAAVDFLAQNDWARWDYSNLDSPDGRLTNFKGIELVASYLLAKNMKLTLKYYKVKQLIPFGVAKETGDRIRLDLDVKI